MVIDSAFVIYSKINLGGASVEKPIAVLSNIVFTVEKAKQNNIA